MDKPTEKTKSNAGENISDEVARSLRLLQAPECRGISKDVFHISDDFHIKVIGDAQAATDDRKGMRLRV